jgi:hypothetical protein
MRLPASIDATDRINKFGEQCQEEQSSRGGRKTAYGMRQQESGVCFHGVIKLVVLRRFRETDL